MQSSAFASGSYSGSCGPRDGMLFLTSTHQGKHGCLSGVHACHAAPVPRTRVSAPRAVRSEHIAFKQLPLPSVAQIDDLYVLKCPPKRWCKQPCKCHPAGIPFCGGWSHCWFYSSPFEALGTVIVWVGWKLRCCDLKGQSAWNSWKVKSCICAVLPVSECGRFSLLSLPVFESMWFSFFPLSGQLLLLFLLTFLLLYMVAAPDAACVYFIQPLLPCNSKPPSVLSRAQPKAKHITATEQYCLVEQLWNNSLGFSLCFTASVSDPFDPVFLGLESSLPALLGVCCMAGSVQRFLRDLSSFSCFFANSQPKGRRWVRLRQQVANAGTVQPVHVHPCSSVRNSGSTYSLLVGGSWSQNPKALPRRACAREYYILLCVQK